MEQQKSFSSALFFALLGFSLVIIVHECGHFIVARLLGLACPLFSIGFGPTLFGILIGKTTFQLALIPLGGYVIIDPQQFNEASYISQCLITIAGIIFNIFFAYIIFFLFSLKKQKFISEEIKYGIKQQHIFNQGILQNSFSLFSYAIQHLNELSIRTFARSKNIIIGPISIIKGLIYAAQDGTFLYLLSIAMLNLNIAFFNLLPIPLLDGGKFVQITVNALFGKQSLSVLIAASIFVFFIIMTLFSYLQKPTHTDVSIENQQ